MSPSPPAAAPEVPAADAPAAVAPDAAEDDGATDEVATFLDAAAASPSPAPEPLPPYAQPVDEPDFQLTALTPELDEVRQQVHEAAQAPDRCAFVHAHEFMRYAPHMLQVSTEEEIDYEVMVFTRVSVSLPARSVSLLVC